MDLLTIAAMALAWGTPIVCLALAGFLFNRMSANQTQVFTSAMTQMREITNRALVLQGLNPHVVDPKTYGPTGMARADEEEIAAKAAAAQTESEAEEAEELRKAEEAYFEKLAKLAQNSSARGDQHN